MDFSFTEEEEAFRKEVRDWIEKETPKRWLELDPLLWEETNESWAISREFKKNWDRKVGWHQITPSNMAAQT